MESSCLLRSSLSVRRERSFVSISDILQLLVGLFEVLLRPERVLLPYLAVPGDGARYDISVPPLPAPASIAEASLAGFVFWARRDAAKLHPEIPVEKFGTVDRALREAEKYDLLIIDGPAHAEKGGLNMARKSKLILMPTCYGLDDLEAQVEAAYELEANGIDRSNIWFVFARTTGSPNEEQAAREYLQRADINMLDPLFAEQPCIRQAHNAGKAASEVSFPVPHGLAVPIALAKQDRGRGAAIGDGFDVHGRKIAQVPC